MKSLDYLKKLKQEYYKNKFPNVPLFAIPVPKFSDKTANGLTKCIIEFLTLEGWQAERINTMGRTIDNRKQITDVLGQTKTIGSTTYIPTTGTKGSADISATIKGFSIKIEVKIKDQQSENQKKYQESIERAGGQYWLVRTFDEFYKRYYNYLNGGNNNQ